MKKGSKHTPESRAKMSQSAPKERPWKRVLVKKVYQKKVNPKIIRWGIPKKDHILYRKMLLKELKKRVFDYYGWRCNCCNETTPQFLTVDHVENDGFKDVGKTGKRLTAQSLYRQVIRLNFPSKYQILCMNCNHGKRMNNGVCPHKSI